MVGTIHVEDWRTRLHRAVRAFAARSETDAVGVDASMLTLLREVGDTLGISCAAFVRTRAWPGEPRVCYQWCEAARSSHWLESAPVEALLAHATLHREPIAVPTASNQGPGEVAAAHRALLDAGLAAAVIVPTAMGPSPRWTWVLGAADTCRYWSDAILDDLQLVGAVMAGALERLRATPGNGERTIPDGRHQPVRRMPPTQPALPLSKRQFDDIIGQSAALQAALTTLEEVIDTSCSVLLLGETGTGKELFARALHHGGPRRAFPLVSVNCGALPPNLIESELFGHQRGAFTGAIAPRQGRFELAHRGTLFLDEIGDLPLDLQAKLLRVLQEGAFERVGSSQTQAVDVRIVAATHHDLERAVANGEFRADLYYRLNVFPIRVPTLRERLDDLPALVWHIIEKRQAQLRRHITHVPDEVWDALRRHSWPGNIRELQNVIEGALIHSTTGVLALREDGTQSAAPRPTKETSLTAVNRLHIEQVLRECDWRINGTGNAAETLGLHPNTLRFRIKKLGIVRRSAGAMARSS